MTVVAQRVFRTGVQTLSYRDGRWFMSIRNRTYRSEVEIPAARVKFWRRRLCP